MAPHSCAFALSECSRSTSGPIEFPPGLAPVVRLPPGLACSPLMQPSPQPKESMQGGSEKEVCASLVFRQKHGIGPPPGLSSNFDADCAVLTQMEGSSDQSTVSDTYVSDGTASDNHDSSSSCGELVFEDSGPEFGPEFSSRLNADAPSFIPSDSSRVSSVLNSLPDADAMSPWSVSSLDGPSLLTGAPVKIHAGFAVQDVMDAPRPACAKAAGSPAQIVPATSWLAAARAAMSEPMSCSKARVACPRVKRCEGATRESETWRGQTSWAAVVKGRTS
eukprot:TRINITY_DN3494_c0_g2_i1.p1 TRINITY_DN3494_c0_g2~~TRINITY_DN3494_c0_g2_i1.p1  ORF type:complete len:277 (+),score=24.25 TRINITY_DN3494_c0_g2_i1:80-910(+)